MGSVRTLQMLVSQDQYVKSRIHSTVSALKILPSHQAKLIAITETQTGVVEAELAHQRVAIHLLLVKIKSALFRVNVYTLFLLPHQPFHQLSPHYLL